VQTQGDFKETFNMAKFADPTWEQKLPPILMKRWPEIVEFQKQCYAVESKVLTLFALALNVWPSSQSDLTIATYRLLYQSSHRS
jgi:isopenicillin N synthase-like dioxygenase